MLPRQRSPDESDSARIFHHQVWKIKLLTLVSDVEVPALSV